MRSFRLASGNDPIQLRQAARMEHAIEEAFSGMHVEAVPVESDDQLSAPLSALGECLLRGAADAAVCPAGMMSSGLPPGVDLGAIFADGPPAYRWVSSGRPDPSSLAHGATVVTWDDVSRAQILFRYPGLRVESARGWTRVFEGLRQGAWAAACLPPEVIDAGSLWGLYSGTISEEEVMPAIGQGTAAILVPAGTADPVLSVLNDRERERRLRLESIFWWNAMDIPETVVTAQAVLEGSTARISGLVADAEGAWLVSDSGEGPSPWAGSVARDVAASCREMAWARRSRRVEHAGRAAS